MQIVKLEAENFKILKAIEITPQGHMITIGGKNAQGKSSVLDAIWVALEGRSVAPVKPIREGEESCRIKLDLGEIIITRTFNLKDGDRITDTVKVESEAGLRYQKPQQVLDALLGQIGFDPFAFVQMKPEAQAERLLEMVPLPIDLDDMAEQDASDFANRRDINRDAAGLKAQWEAIEPVNDLPEAGDRAQLVAKLASASEHNATIVAYDNELNTAEQNQVSVIGRAKQFRETAESLRKQAEEADQSAIELEKKAEEIQAEIDAMPERPEPYDTDQIRQAITAADQAQHIIDAQARRADLKAAWQNKVAEAEGFTKAMATREKERTDALGDAQMPIEGLGFSTDEKGRSIVTYGGQPFTQASTAEQLRVSTAIAMAGDPDLRVLRIKDGSLLDEDSIKIIAEMAEADDFQLWCEFVGSTMDGGKPVGIILEDGMIKGSAPKKAEASDE